MRAGLARAAVPHKRHSTAPWLTRMPRWIAGDISVAPLFEDEDMDFLYADPNEVARRRLSGDPSAEHEP